MFDDAVLPPPPPSSAHFDADVVLVADCLLQGRHADSAVRDAAHRLLDALPA
jgi:hypothetical protein